MSFYLYSINTGFYINSSGYVGILNSNPQYALDISGDCKASHFLGNGTGVTYQIKIGGQIANQYAQVSGNDTAGFFSIKTPIDSGDASYELRINFKNFYNNDPFVVCSNADPSTIAYMQNKFLFGFVADKSGISIVKSNDPTFPLGPEQTYRWNYIVIGK